MTAKSSRRVVIINNIKSDKIEQAIFILKGSGEQKPNRFVVREAQEIIDNYIRRVEGKGETLPPLSNSAVSVRRKRGISGGLVTALAIAFLLSLVLVVRYFTA